MNRSRNSAVGALALFAVVPCLLSGCGAGDEAACAEAFERAALSVDDVVSADFECKDPFGNPSQWGDIVLAADTQEDAESLIEGVYRAFAAEPDLDGSWRPNIGFAQEVGDLTFRGLDVDLEFKGKPSVRDMREGYDIHPIE